MKRSTPSHHFGTLLALTIALAAFPVGAQTTTSRVETSDLEPITLPKLEAGKVTARVNETVPVAAKPLTPGVIEERVRGRTVVRVTPDGAPSYYLTESLNSPTTRRRDSESLSVPQWQLFKF